MCTGRCVQVGVYRCAICKQAGPALTFPSFSACTAILWSSSSSMVPFPSSRDLHSSTFRLNVSAFCGKGAAIRGGLEAVYGVVGGISGCLGHLLCQKRLRLS